MQVRMTGQICDVADQSLLGEKAQRLEYRGVRARWRPGEGACDTCRQHENPVSAEAERLGDGCVVRKRAVDEREALAAYSGQQTRNGGAGKYRAYGITARQQDLLPREHVGRDHVNRDRSVLQIGIRQVPGYEITQSIAGKYGLPYSS